MVNNSSRVIKVPLHRIPIMVKKEKLLTSRWKNPRRSTTIRIADSTFWFLFALGIVILAVFPRVAYVFCDILNIESPVNFVYLVIIAILVIRHFMTTVEIAHLRSKLTSLVQEEGLERHEREQKRTGRRL